MEVLYIHIGTHKTGTTNLQTFFRDNRALLRKNGIVYPKSGRARMGAHHHLVSSIRIPIHPVFKPRRPFIEYIKRLWNEVPEDSNCLISSEIFNETINFSQLELFKTIAKRVKIIVYLRRQDTFLESAYSFFLRGGGKMSFEYYRKHLSLDYFDLCNKYGDVFGRENIIVRPYEKQQFHGDNIFTDFLNVLGLELTDDYRIPQKNLNPSLSRDAFEYSYCINRLPLTKEEVFSFSEILLAFSGRLGKDAIFLPHNIFSQKERIALMKEYLEGNTRVAHEYLDRSDGTLFYKQLLESNKEDELFKGLTDERVIEITRYILDHSSYLAMTLRNGIIKGLQSDNSDEQEAAKKLSPVLMFEISFFKRITYRFKKYFIEKISILKSIKELISNLYTKLN